MDLPALTAMADRVVGDRYRIDALIGAGPISAVFTAVDEVDDERVALKIFDERLANDTSFIDELFDALERAAELDHPGIVEIRDWGVDNGPYIVSELCEGGSLASLLDEGHTLEPGQALVMALECARALDHGHEQGIVHRNLTPRSVLFTDDERVRVADFGLAKILAEAPVAQADRALENVRYVSPEQARGRPATAASDMYSLAMVVSEAVSGVEPAVADTVVETLMERAEAEALLHPALGALRGPIERCGRVDPDERPEAEELCIALLAAAETMARPGPLPLVGIGYAELDDWFDEDPDLDAEVGRDRNAKSSAESGAESDDLAVARVPGGGDGDAGAVAPVLDVDFGPDEGAAVGAAVGAGTEHGDLDGGDLEEADFEDADLEDADFDVSLLGELDDLDAFAAEDDDIAPPIVIDTTAIDTTHVNTTHVDTTDVDGARGADFDVPIVVGAEASTRRRGGVEDLESTAPVFADDMGTDADESALDVPDPVGGRRTATLTYQEQDDDADDRLPWWPLVALVLVIAAAIAAGVYFFAIEDSTETASVPDLVGASFDEAETIADARNWELVRLEGRADGSEPGAILLQSPAPGEHLEENESLSVTVSLGNEMVEIPSDIVGLTVEQAGSRLAVDGLGVGQITERENEDLATGLVIRANEPTTQLPRGESVDLIVSTGPQDRIVPADVIGMTIGDATSALVALRLQAVEEPTYDPEIEVGIVLDASPAPGAAVPADSAVTLFVSAGPEPVEMPDIVGLQLDEAIDVIEELGLIWIDTEGTPGEDVIGSLPPIGATVDVGTEVTIILDDPPEDADE